METLSDERVREIMEAAQKRINWTWSDAFDELAALCRELLSRREAERKEDAKFKPLDGSRP